MYITINTLQMMGNAGMSIAYGLKESHNRTFLVDRLTRGEDYGYGF